MRAKSVWIVALLATWLVVGCTSAGFENTDITGASFARSLKLTDHHGHARTLADYQGKVLLIAFGYTQCPDFCPATLAKYRAVLDLLGSDSAKVQGLFVSLDPARDAALLKDYVPAFHPSFVGLTGTDAEVQTAASEFKVIYQKAKGATEQSYTVDHSTFTYVFDRQGRVRLLAQHAVPAESLARDIKKLIN